MRPPQAHAAERRAEALRLLRDTRLTIDEIGARTATSSRRRSGLERPGRLGTAAAAAPRLATARWTAARRASVARLLATRRQRPRRRREALGFGAHRGAAVADPGRGPAERAPPARRRGMRPIRRSIRRSCGRTCAPTSPGRSPPSTRRWRGGDPPLRDSARVLRDLGGLKRLLDDARRGHARAARRGRAAMAAPDPTCPPCARRSRDAMLALSAAGATA